jgi:hypothetical protein
MSERVRVSVFDPATGETETQELPEDSYILICGERCWVSHRQWYPRTGTHQITIKTCRSPDPEQDSVVRPDGPPVQPATSTPQGQPPHVPSPQVRSQFKTDDPEPSS